MHQDLFDDFPTIPTRYAFDDDSGDEDIAEVVDKLDLDTVSVDLNGMNIESDYIIIFGVYGPGEVFLKASYGVNEKVGTILTKDKVFDHYTSIMNRSNG